MTHDDMVALLDELTANQDDPEGFYTTDEWAGVASLSVAVMRQRMKAAKNLGRLEVRKVRREATDGTMRTVPAYRITPAA